MGRPIKKKFFGSDNVNDNLTYSDAGGEGVVSITVTSQGNNYSQGTTITFAASPIGGTTATGTATVWSPASSSNLSFKIGGTTVSDGGTGYLTAPAITINKPANVVVSASAFSGNLAGNILTVASTTGIYVGMHTTGVGLATTSHVKQVWSGNGNVLMSSGVTPTFTAGNVTFYDRGAGASLTAVLASVITTANTIQANAWISTGTIGKVADIVSQRSSRRYKINNADGTDVCRLVPSFANAYDSVVNNTLEPNVAQVTAAGGPVNAGEMTIVATDSAGGTYWVGKLMSRTVILFPAAIGGGSAGTQFTANSHVQWTSTGSAVLNTSVKLATNN